MFPAVQRERRDAPPHGQISARVSARVFGFRALAVCAALAVTAGCDTISGFGGFGGGGDNNNNVSSGPGAGIPGEIIEQGFYGAVAADEPRAALIGRDILTQGGSAADAATAMYFVLSVTMPSAASLGGGGVCVYHDFKTQKVEALDFLARAPKNIPPGAPFPNAVPGNPRGFFALQAKYGVMRWAGLMRPSVQLARFGTQVSRAFTRQIDAARDRLAKDPEIVRVFARPSGRGLVREGDFLEQVDLAAVLGRISSKGPGDFYSGRLARQIIEGAKAAGGGMTLEDMRGYAPVWRETVKIDGDGWQAYFAPPPALAGAAAHAMLAMLTEGDMYEGDDDERAHGLAEAAMRAFADRAGWAGDLSAPAASPAALSNIGRLEPLMDSYDRDVHTPADALRPRPDTKFENASAATFIAVDRLGSAAACAVSMHNLFGTGRIAAGTGVFLAAAPDETRGPAPLGPVVAFNDFSEQLFFAGAASGGLAAPTSLINIMARTLLEDESLENAMAAPRVHHHGKPDVTYVEQSMPDKAAKALEARGHKVKKTPVLGRVNALVCPGGLDKAPGACQIMADPRGPGLAAAADIE